MTTAAPTLAGWYVISLRPSGTHDAVRRAAVARGARLLSLSTLRLVGLPAAPALQAALACPRVVFTSPAAVRFAAKLQPLRLQPGQHAFAVGAGTAAALRRAGIPGAIAPAGRGDSESLLALPGLQAPGGVGLVTAPGGRGVIADALARRGACVHRADVYRREPTRPRADRLASLSTLPAHSALLVSSAEAFDAFWLSVGAPAGATASAAGHAPEGAPAPGATALTGTTSDARRTLLRGRPVVASSPRLAARLAEEGFTAIVTAESATPARMLDALAADVAAGRFR